MRKQSRFSPSDLFLQLGAEQQIGEEEDMPQLPGSLHQLHHETVPQKLAALWQRQTTEVGSVTQTISAVGNQLSEEAHLRAVAQKLLVSVCPLGWLVE